MLVQYLKLLTQRLYDLANYLQSCGHGDVSLIDANSHICSELVLGQNKPSGDSGKEITSVGFRLLLNTKSEPQKKSSTYN